MRQRIRVGRSRAVVAGQVLAGLLALVVAWYAAMLVLLALKAPDGLVDQLSGYRTALTWLSALDGQAIGATARVLAGVGGAVVFVVLGSLALAQVPRPRAARDDVMLHDDERGQVVVRPRAVERAAEASALDEPAVSAASARYETDRIHVQLTLKRAGAVVPTLHNVHQHVTAALERHDLPGVPVDVLITALDPSAPRRVS